MLIKPLKESGINNINNMESGKKKFDKKAYDKAYKATRLDKIKEYNKQYYEKRKAQLNDIDKVKAELEEAFKQIELLKNQK